MRQQQLSEEAVRDATELRLRAERKLGQFLKENVHAGRPAKMSNGSTFLPDGISPTNPPPGSGLRRCPNRSLRDTSARKKSRLPRVRILGASCRVLSGFV